MTIELLTNPAASKSHLLAENAMEILSARLRPAGLYLLMQRADDSIACFDGAADIFFNRYVRPMLESREAEGLRANAGARSSDSKIQICTELPGLTVAMFSYAERRQPQ